MLGTSTEKRRTMDNPKLRDSKFFSRNFWFSGCCEFSTLMRAAPNMLSFIILLRASITLRLFLKITLAFRKIIKNAVPIIGTIPSTASANFQFISTIKTDTPIMINSEEIIATKACATNVFTESISDVRFVSNREGLEPMINEELCWDSLFIIFLRKSRATLSAVYVCMTPCNAVKINIPVDAIKNCVITF